MGISPSSSVSDHWAVVTPPSKFRVGNSDYRYRFSVLKRRGRFNEVPRQMEELPSHVSARLSLRLTTTPARRTFWVVDIF